ncbi:calcineurin-like phosphoesterase C-terminal domain-containing protein [Pedobacter metabolipauper]|uniref:Calcineurin-like phosphoesterase family protein n=1 Tax=Pedobacter metabolipauper TaxID=425513 RepID=A0A4R6SU95_9SPHI|nr:calcineurin-like phosphoesterase family protein [Pedobacter metabolipauper]TDQ07636.1 calcineurin-like phosphoesterase family protein [Pedobacter metabolipauper]
MNRRIFIQRLGLITGGAFISLKTSAFGSFERSKQINGRVLSGNKGLANVVVSDGYSVVLTDAKGNYTLNTDDLALTIFISTPAGYEFKTDYQTVAKQYEKLGSRTEYTFNLVPLKKSDTRHNFIIWADPQVKNKKDVQQMMDTSVPDVQQLLKTMDPAVPVHGICVGDIVWDNHALFEDYNLAVARMGIPFFQALGNHDMDYRAGGDETSDRTFKEIYGPTYYSFNRGKAHYVVLDNVRYLGTERDYDGYISEQQLAWLKEDLKYVKKDQLVIICLHIPVYNGVKNNTALYALLTEHKNVHIMSGHTHYNANSINDGIFEHNHGTVCGAWWTGPVCSDGTPRGYGVYEVNGNKLSWYYKPTGQDRNNQMRIYVDELTNQKRLIANVWNWDPEWKVEYFLDDKPMGSLEQQEGYDPLTVTLYKGDQLPKGRVFVEPHQMDHLFMAHFSPSVKKVKVVVTDRFGHKYAETVGS